MDQIVTLTPAKRLEDKLEAVGLRAGRLWKGKVGESRQVRQELRCKVGQTDKFVAFFCQYTVPKGTCRGSEVKTCSHSFLTTGNLDAKQRKVANAWLDAMQRRYPGLPFGHPSK